MREHTNVFKMEILYALYMFVKTMFHSISQCPIGKQRTREKSNTESKNNLKNAFENYQ